jgi:hypothetical protein
MSQIIGHISQVIGPVVDVYFEGKGIDTDLLTCEICPIICDISFYLLLFDNIPFLY